MSDKVDEIVKRWELILDQLNGLEYHILNETPVDGIDVGHARSFASVRSQLSTLLVQYQKCKSKIINGQDNDTEYDFGAPRFSL
jgi:hypothetical protein